MHPFDAQRSGRDPFPCFTTAMRMPDERSSDSDSNGSCACDDAETCDGGEPCQSLNWSIGELATLLPRSFSPLSIQKRTPLTHHRVRRRRRWSTGGAFGFGHSVPRVQVLIEETPPRSTTFFEDEKQFGVLRTPAEVIQRELHMGALPQESSGSECADWRAPGASRRRELHRRCVDTMQLCEARVRERQLRLARIQIPATKLKLKRGVGGLVSSSSQRRSAPTTGGSKPSPFLETSVETRRDPLTPVVATRLSFGSIDVSPIPIDHPHAASIQLHEPLFVTPTKTTPRANTNTESMAFSSPALSSIAENPSDVLTPSFASLEFSPSRDFDHEEEEKENKENQPSPAGEDEVTTSPSSLRTLSLLHGATPGASSSASSVSPLSGQSGDSTTAARERRELVEDANIAARQKLFMAAIEEEAHSRDVGCLDENKQRPAERDGARSESESDVATGKSLVKTSRLNIPASSDATRKSPAPATSVASIYKEARALGLTEPTAQWEYVQLISRQTGRSRSARFSL